METNTTFLQLSHSITDNIAFVINESKDNHVIPKVWYNGVLKWSNVGVTTSDPVNDVLDWK